MITRRCWMLTAAGLPLAAEISAARGKKIVEESIAALGGKAFVNMRDRTETGRVYSFYSDRLSGLSRAKIYTRYLTKPSPMRADFFGLRERQSFGKDKEDSAVLFTEVDGWSISFRGARPIGKELEDRFRDSTRRNIFYLLRVRLDEPGMLIEHLGDDTADNLPVHVVHFTDAENRVVKAFFHISTKLPVRQEYVRRDDKTRDRIDEVSRFAKFRDVNGVQWPFQIQRERNGGKYYEIFAESVQINSDLKDDLFTLPGNLKVLPPAR
ncbi:MAG: hypothetical protein HYZ37_18840 [Candidatus Solibacter usitatus]|nr:hypothetical protein [Candidatus Solibacter usitatus]